MGQHTVLSKYILDRWRKDIKRKYTFVKSNYDTTSIDDARRYDRIQNRFNELCSNASKAESSCVKLISQIEQLKTQYPGIADHDTSNIVDTAPSTEASTPRVLSPFVVRSKGRPPSKRKVHPAEKSIKKSSTKRQLHNNQAEDQQSQVWTHAPEFFSTPSTAHHSQDNITEAFHQDFSAF
ncbi:uncharacterized protein LOC121254526 [Juglans microcarpa x Juglans regia]|uniref:uncharacterized protein LOC121254526 n=1 Tax=Juglans microcarpa x Juglans regia TaxID=2249226 RepID=UPI001B7D9D0B|nr:uncharacterized protein LOC121254526 [Juglans microcarpa x Juglans regia]